MLIARFFYELPVWGVFRQENEPSDFSYKFEKIETLSFYPEKDVMPMQRAIGSKKDFSNVDEDQLLAEYEACVRDIMDDKMVTKMDDYVQHCNTSRLQHSINVSYYSFLICYRMGWDYRSAARAGILHDLYFYDWRIKKSIRSHHASWHPRIALDNAKKITELNKVEKDAILKHMWPCTIIPPRYIESYVVTMVDKLCAICEVAEKQYQVVRTRRVALS